jgi:murein DD-endopeptidase MepM/ murein hydrolase activator NlpD
LQLYGIRTVSGGALATCPVAGPHSYIDSFGAPRVGHTHQGDDIMAARGTPVVAAQAGNAVPTPNGLGGNAMIVYAGNGDYTYYAHLDSYGASGRVSAGTQIGTVGNTGDAAGGPTHLHFEYHPGGGSAVDPTPYLDAVC